MYDVFKVVNWFRAKNCIELQQDENVEELTQMKVMKLLYYVQAASLVILNKRMFDNDIVAWKYGPVVVEVHDKYRNKRSIVDPDNIDPNMVSDYKELQADEQVRDILNSIYAVYGGSSAIDLMKQTHKEKPWQETRQSQIISDEAIRSYYSGVFVVE